MPSFPSQFFRQPCWVTRREWWTLKWRMHSWPPAQLATMCASHVCAACWTWSLTNAKYTLSVGDAVQCESLLWYTLALTLFSLYTPYWYYLTLSKYPTHLHHSVHVLASKCTHVWPPDTLSVVIMALHCAQHQRRHDLRRYIDQALHSLLKQQAPDGSFHSNLHTTALALQVSLTTLPFSVFGSAYFAYLYHTGI